MIRQKFFAFENICTLENYFIFIEGYLKENHILKKDFLTETKINAGTYRSFLKNTSRNGKYFYNIISKHLNIFLPDENRIKELNEEFETYLYDFIYMRYDNLKVDLEQMEKYIQPKIECIEQIPFTLLGTLIQVSLDKYNYDDEIKIAIQGIRKVESYLEILPRDFRVIYEVLNFLIHSFDKNQILMLGNQLRMACSDITIINGVVLNLIASSTYHKDDYLNAILYVLEACDIFYKQNNYVRLILTRLNLSMLFLLADDYDRGYQVFKEMSYFSDLLDEKLQRRVQSGLFNSYILMEQYDNAYTFYIKKADKLRNRVSSKVEFLYVCYKLNKVEKFKEVYAELIEKWKNNELFVGYYHIAKLINSMYLGKIAPNQQEKTLELIGTLKNKVTKKIFSTFFKNLVEK